MHRTWSWAEAWSYTRHTHAQHTRGRGHAPEAQVALAESPGSANDTTPLPPLPTPPPPDDRGNLFAACRAKTPALALLPRTLHITDTRTRTIQPTFKRQLPLAKHGVVP